MDVVVVAIMVWLRRWSYTSSSLTPSLLLSSGGGSRVLFLFLFMLFGRYSLAVNEITIYKLSDLAFISIGFTAASMTFLLECPLKALPKFCDMSGDIHLLPFGHGNRLANEWFDIWAMPLPTWADTQYLRPQSQRDVRLVLTLALLVLTFTLRTPTLASPNLASGRDGVVPFVREHRICRILHCPQLLLAVFHHTGVAEQHS